MLWASERRNMIRDRVFLAGFFPILAIVSSFAAAGPIERGPIRSEHAAEYSNRIRRFNESPDLSQWQQEVVQFLPSSAEEIAGSDVEALREVRGALNSTVDKLYQELEAVWKEAKENPDDPRVTPILTKLGAMSHPIVLDLLDNSPSSEKARVRDRRGFITKAARMCE